MVAIVAGSRHSGGRDQLPRSFRFAVANARRIGAELGRPAVASATLPHAYTVAGGLMGAIEPWHLIVVLVVALLVLGPKRLPEVGKSLGDTIREFRKSIAETRDSVSGTTPAAAAAPPAPAATPAPPAVPAAPPTAEATRTASTPPPGAPG